jgi:hypothetical protein
MKRIKSKPQDSKFPLRLALPPAPKWRRRRPSPDPSRGRLDQGRAELRLIVPGEGSGPALD